MENTGGKKHYEGAAFSMQDIVDMLREQGLEIEDEQRALHVLSNVSYTRLKNYLVSLMEDRDAHRFAPGTTFEQAYALYGFDRRLRELIFHELEKIEISVRTHIAFVSNCNERGYWFLNPAHFKNARGHQSILKHLRNELDRSDNEGVVNFFRKYDNEFPPSWITIEATSMGTLATIYKEMSDESLRERISDYYGLTPQLFYCWIHHLVWIRNTCAHHNRVWNINLPQVMLPGGGGELQHPFPKMDGSDGSRHHIYLTLCIIKYFANTIKPENTFTQRLRSLIGNFKMVDPALMGFPENWFEHPLWAEK